MINAVKFQVFDILLTKLGEAEAKTIIEYFEAKADEKYEQKRRIFWLPNKIYLVLKIL